MSMPARGAGRTFAYTSSPLRSPSRPCPGRTLPVPHFGPPTAPSSTARDSRQAASVDSGSGSPSSSIAAPPNGSWTTSTSTGKRSSTRTACSVTSGPIPSPGSAATNSATSHLSLHEVEHEADQFLDALVRERAFVERLQVLDERCFARRVEERNSVLLLVAAQLRDLLEPRVHRREELLVERGDLVAVRLDHAAAPSRSSSSSTSASIVIPSRTSTTFGVFRPVPVTSRTTQSSSATAPAAAAARSAPTVTPAAVSPKTPVVAASSDMFGPTSSSGTA